MEHKNTKENLHHMDRPLIVKIISSLICAAMLVGIPVTASTDRVAFAQHPHELSEVIVVAEADCVNAGVAYQECRYEGCNYTAPVELPVLGHQVIALEHLENAVSCSRCSGEFAPEFMDVDGVLCVYAFEQPVEDYTGFVTCEGEQWYARDGVKNTEYEGLYHGEETVYYVSGGKVQSDYTDYYYEDGKKWYVKEGVAYDHYCGEVEFTWPTPDCWIITSYFGLRDQPTAGASTDHKGIDIGAMPGVKIVAAASGTVIESAYNDLRGNYVIIKHGDGLQTIYMHCTEVFVSTGESVDMGEKIATVGSTGNVSGPHLHMGVYLDGTPVNPMFYLPY